MLPHPSVAQLSREVKVKGSFTRQHHQAGTKGPRCPACHEPALPEEAAVLPGWDQPLGALPQVLPRPPCCCLPPVMTECVKDTSDTRAQFATTPGDRSHDPAPPLFTGGSPGRGRLLLSPPPAAAAGAPAPGAPARRLHARRRRQLHYCIGQSPAAACPQLPPATQGCRMRACSKPHKSLTPQLSCIYKSWQQVDALFGGWSSKRARTC